jgi:hypothetical protein
MFILTLFLSFHHHGQLSTHHVVDFFMHNVHSRFCNVHPQYLVHAMRVILAAFEISVCYFLKGLNHQLMHIVGTVPKGFDAKKFAQQAVCFRVNAKPSHQCLKAMGLYPGIKLGVISSASIIADGKGHILAVVLPGALHPELLVSVFHCDLPGITLTNHAGST